MQRAYVLCHLMKKTDENTGPDEAVAGGFSPGINFMVCYLNCLSFKKLSLMNMEFDNSSTGSGNGLANNMTLGAGLSHHASDIVSDIGNYQVEEMILDVRISF